MMGLTVYFLGYCLVTGFMHEGKYVIYVCSTITIFNILFTAVGLAIYMYTIMMLRNAFYQCSTFQFETCGTYFICIIYVFVLGFQVAYLILYKLMDSNKMVIILALCHFISYFFIQVGVFAVLAKTGQGLKLVPHKLVDNRIQYEGYDSNNKHLFTFTLPDVNLAPEEVRQPTNGTMRTQS